jgi:hypothetical protein
MASSVAALSGYSLYLHKYKLLLRAQRGGWPFFQGHNCLWRTSSLRGIAPLSEQLNGQAILVEDTSMTLRANRLGYHSKALEYPAGFWVPARLSDLEAMLVRWSYGGSQMLIRERFGMLGEDRSHLLIGEHIDVLYHFVYPKWESLFPFIFPAINFNLASTAFLLLIWSTNRLLLDIIMLVLRPRPLHFLQGKGMTVLAHFLLFINFRSWCEVRANLEFVTQRRLGWVPTGKSGTSSEKPQNLSVFRRYQPFLMPLTFYGSILLIIILSLHQSSPEIRDVLASIPLVSQAIGVIAMILIYAGVHPTYPKDLGRHCSIRRWQ